MRSDLHYITKSEFSIRIVIYIYYLFLFIFGRSASLPIYILSIAIILCGSFVRILSFNKKVFVNTPKPEGFYRASRHPMLFSYFFYSLPIPAFLGINFFSITFFILFLFFIYITFNLSEKFYNKLYSQNVVYKSKTPGLFPNMKISLKTIFEKETKPVIDTYEILPAIVPLLVIVFIEHFGFTRLLEFIKNFFI